MDNEVKKEDNVQEVEETQANLAESEKVLERFLEVLSEPSFEVSDFMILPLYLSAFLRTHSTTGRKNLNFARKSRILGIKSRIKGIGSKFPSTETA